MAQLDQKHISDLVQSDKHVISFLFSELNPRRYFSPVYNDL